MITIVTPTYNRIELLTRLYESLLEQNTKEFVWLIVDDGSNDGTSERVGQWIQEHKLIIKLLCQENGGKHRALNRAIKEVTTPLTFIVDSDDYLPQDSIQSIMRYVNKYSKYKEDLKLCGFSFLRCYENGEVNTAYFPKDEIVGTFCNVRINGGILGDKAEVFFTDVLRRYPFSEYEGERFMPEDAVWMRMSGPWQMVHINQCIYISEYLDGGLTRSGRKHKIESPKGMIERSIVYLENEHLNFITAVKMMLLYIVYSKFDGRNYSTMRSFIARHALLNVLYLPGIVVYKLWKH